MVNIEGMIVHLFIKGRPFIDDPVFRQHDRKTVGMMRIGPPALIIIRIDGRGCRDRIRLLYWIKLDAVQEAIIQIPIFLAPSVVDNDHIQLALKHKEEGIMGIRLCATRIARVDSRRSCDDPVWQRLLSIHIVIDQPLFQVGTRRDKISSLVTWEAD